MIPRIETSINNVFLLPQAYTGVEDFCSQEPSKARLCPNRCQRVPDLGPRYFVPNNEKRMGAAWSNRVVQLPFRSRGGGALFDPGRFASGRFHGKNGSRSAGLGHRPQAQACMCSVSHDRGLIPHDDEDQPAGFIGLMKGRLPVPCDQGLVEADEQWLQPMQALGHRARRQVQPQPPPRTGATVRSAAGWRTCRAGSRPGPRRPTAPWGSVRARPAR